MRTKRQTGAANPVADIADTWNRERPDLDLNVILQHTLAVRLGRLLDRAHDQYTRNTFGISSSDMRVLFALRRAGPPYSRRPTDLYRALLVTSGAMTKHVDRLAQKGLVRRLSDPMDAGGTLVQLTDEGQAVADQAIEAVANSTFLEKGEDRLTPEERAILVTLYRKVLSGLTYDT